MFQVGATGIDGWTDGTKKLNSVVWSVSELYRLNDRSMSANLVPTFVDRACRVVSVTDPDGR
jgi:hypothetical protein